MQFDVPGSCYRSVAKNNAGFTNVAEEVWQRKQIERRKAVGCGSGSGSGGRNDSVAREGGMSRRGVHFLRARCGDQKAVLSCISTP